jgi:RNA-directed DNA polymerase
MDDIYLLTKSKKAANFAIKELIRFTGTLGMTIKPSWRIISKIDPPKDHKIHQKRQSYIDIVGYRVYPDKVTLRNRDYAKCKIAFKRLNKKKSIHNSQSAVSYYGMLKNSDSYRFRKKYHVKRLNRQARRYISHESKIQRETGPGEIYDHRGKDNGADLHQ